MAKANINGFAKKEDLAALYRHKDNAFFLGRIHPDHGVNIEAGIDDDRGLFVMSGTRSGKGRTLIINNLIMWGENAERGGGVFVIDPKGENASITAMRRGKKEYAKSTDTTVTKFIGQNVAILDPYSIVKGAARIYRASYNPLSDIDIKGVEATGEILSIAETLVISEEGSGKHFSDSAETILAGIIEAVLVLETGENQTLPFCMKVMQKPYKETLNFLSRCKTSSGLALEARSIMEIAGEEEYGSFRTTLSRQLRFMADVRVKEHLSHSDFSLVDAMRENWSIYVCVPPALIGRVNRWLRMITRIAFDARMSEGYNYQGQQMLFVLDEFAQLGTQKILEDSSSYVATYGIKLMPIIQNLGQVKKLYPNNWETFLGNAVAIIAWGLNDLETEEYLSKRMGSVWEWDEGVSVGQSSSPNQPASSSTNFSYGKKERAIRWPNEIHYQGAREYMRGFVISGKGAPFMIERLNYDELFNKRYYDDV